MEKKSNGGLIAIIIVLVIALLGLSFYVAYDKGLIFNNEEDVEEKEENQENVELDINSRLVQSLYNKVKYAFIQTLPNREFYSDDIADEEFKMYIVGMNLSEAKDSTLSTFSKCKDIPDTIEGYKGYSSCKQIEGLAYNFSSYSKDYVEYLYKDIYGKDAVLNTNIPIKITSSKYYHYVELGELQEYVLYNYYSGGTTSYNAQELLKATKTNNEIKIYEKATNDVLMPGEYTMVYTFKLDKDGMYSFYSRTKE